MAILLDIITCSCLGHLQYDHLQDRQDEDYHQAEEELENPKLLQVYSPFLPITPPMDVRGPRAKNRVYSQPIPISSSSSAGSSSSSTSSVEDITRMYRVDTWPAMEKLDLCAGEEASHTVHIASPALRLNSNGRCKKVPPPPIFIPPPSPKMRAIVIDNEPEYEPLQVRYPNVDHPLPPQPRCKAPTPLKSIDNNKLEIDSPGYSYESDEDPFQAFVEAQRRNLERIIGLAYSPDPHSFFDENHPSSLSSSSCTSSSSSSTSFHTSAAVTAMSSMQDEDYGCFKLDLKRIPELYGDVVNAAGLRDMLPHFPSDRVMTR